MLTDLEIKGAELKAKPYKKADSGGLFLIINPNGSKYWRLSYRYAGKQKTLALGVYPSVSLKRARKKAGVAKDLLDRGIDPSQDRKDTLQKQKENEEKKKVEEVAAVKNKFRAVAEAWLEVSKQEWTKGHHDLIARRLEVNVYPWLGDTDIAEIKAPELLEVLQRIELRGANEVAKRVRMICGQVFKFAIAGEQAVTNPAQYLSKRLKKVESGSFAAITDAKEFGGLLRAIDEYQGAFQTRCALQLLSLVFVRPSEIRHLQWDEIEGSTWTIPAHKRKMMLALKKKKARAHVVPLSVQALAVLERVKPLTGHAKYVFHGIRSEDKPMSENTLNQALRRLGYTKEEMTSHGFRSSASTLLNGLGFNSDWIERQLAHVEGNAVRRAYNRAEYLQERRQMMQSWADYLDGLRSGANVIPIHRADRV